jgi:hypothetical protein
MDTPRDQELLDQVLRARGAWTAPAPGDAAIPWPARAAVRQA